MTDKRIKDYYHDRVEVVTGVTSGNGRALANELLAYGATVIGIGRRKKDLRSSAPKGDIGRQKRPSSHSGV